MSTNEKLDQVLALVKSIRDEIDQGANLTSQDVTRLEVMGEMLQGLRNYAICADPGPGKVVARRWKLSEARVCQIRSLGPSAIFARG